LTVGHWQSAIVRRASVRRALLWRFVRATHPPFQQQRPKGHRAGDDEQAKSPRALRRVRINSLYSHEHEWDSEHQPAREIDSQAKK
jgi:hypothetical protein